MKNLVTRISGIVVLGLIAVLAVVQDASAETLVLTAVLTYAPTTSSVDLVKMWRKIQADIVVGFNFMCEEWEMLDALTELSIDWSTREMLVPIDLNEGYGAASIPEGGYEALPSSPTVEELTLAWILYNKRFTATLTAQYIDQNKRAGMITRQITQQATKAVEAIGNMFGDDFYGFSTGILAQTKAAGAAATSHTITPENGYGRADILEGPFLARKFQVGDRIALVRAGSLVTNALGTVTARDVAAGTIGVTWKGSVTIAEHDNIVKANSIEDTTLAGTNYNKGLVGLLEMATATAVHGLTHDNWEAALVNTTSARFHTVDLLRARDEIEDKGGGTVNMILSSRGVYRDVVDNQLSNVQFDSQIGMEIDGSVKSPSGVTWKRTKRVPPKHVFLWDKKSVRKMTLLPKPKKGSVVWGDGEKIPDRSARVFSMDFPCATVVLNRGNMALYTNRTEQ